MFCAISSLLPFWFQLDAGCNISMCATDSSCPFCTLKLSWSHIWISLLFPDVCSFGLKWQEYWEIDSSALYVNTLLISCDSCCSAELFGHLLLTLIVVFLLLYFTLTHTDFRLIQIFFLILLLTSLSHNTFTSFYCTSPPSFYQLCDSLGRYCFPVKWTLAEAECFLQ